MARKPRRTRRGDDSGAADRPASHRASARERALARHERRAARKQARSEDRASAKARKAEVRAARQGEPSAGDNVVPLRPGSAPESPAGSEQAGTNAEPAGRRTPIEWLRSRRSPREWWHYRRQRNAQRPPKPKLKKLRFLLVISGLIVLAGISWLFGIMMAVANDLPNLQARAQYNEAENSVIYDITGTKLTTLKNNEGRLLVESEEIASTMKEATVAIEDERFYQHRGVDFQGIARAAVQDIASGSASQGASTITQQFVKTALEAQQKRNVFQKLTEAAYAYHIEREWNKDKILTEYLNSIYFGEGAYGIEAASQTYWGWNHLGCGEENGPTCASQLTPPEAALLAALIQAPSAYSLDANLARDRRDVVLQKMAEQEKISDSELTTYLDDDLPAPSMINPPAEDSAAPYFTSWLRQQLVDHYGTGKAFGGGLQVKSTLDLELQRAAENVVQTRLAAIEPTAAVVVIDNATGGVRAMVGGPDYETAPFNIATNGYRQPGSSFKPFTLITALQNGGSTDDVYPSQYKEFGFDVKTPEGKKIHDLFKVNNYDDAYYGAISLGTATKYSDNSVFSEVGLKYGVDEVAETARSMGIESDLADAKGNEYSVGGKPYESYNPAIILGGLGTGVTPMEMAHAYETLANEGNRVWGTMGPIEGSGENEHPTGPVGIVKVTDNGGDSVEDKFGASGINEPVLKQVIDPGVANSAATAMTAVVTDGTGKNAQVSGQTIWGKTGTTDDNGDAWFCGSTVAVTICVWVGHADSRTPMETEFGGNPVDGGTFPALIFHDVLLAYLEIMERREAGEDSSAVLGTTTADPSTGTYTPPATGTPEAPIEETPAAPATDNAAPATGGGNNGGGGGQTPAAPPTGGGGIG